MSVNEQLQVVFVGGTQRAVNLFPTIIDRNDVQIVYAIFMKGYENEWAACQELTEIANRHSILYDVSEKIDSHIIDKVKMLKPDVILGGGIWRTKIPSSLYQRVTHGYLSLHGSALPKYRGWASINWYIINGEPKYILRMFQLGDGLDDGPLVARSDGTLFEYEVDLNNEKHVGEILEDVYRLHVGAYHELLDALIMGSVVYIPQNHEDATYTCNRSPEDGEIHWGNKTEDIFNFIRAQSTPYPGAYTFFDGEKVTIWRARPRREFARYVGRIPGKVVDRDSAKRSVCVLTMDSAVEILAAESKESSDVLRIFDSVRKRCKTEHEALCERFAQTNALDRRI